MTRGQLSATAAIALVTLVLTACAGTAGQRRASGEPSPKDAAEAPAAEPVEGAAAEAPAERAEAAPLPPPPPPVAPAGYGPVGKPRIVAKVDKVQFPAWVERAGIKAGIKAGWAIYTSDRIITGSDGRVVLSVAGEGRLKIGGNAVVALTPNYEITGGPEPPFFTLQRGTVSFSAPMVRSATTGTLVELGEAIRANLLGGHLIGKVDGEESLLALVDGLAQVSGPKLNPGTMKTPNTFLRVPRVGKAQPVNEAAADRMARWTSLAEPLKGRPALAAEGQWDVSLNSGYNLKQLETMACQIQRRGFPSEIYPVREPGKQVWYRVVVRRFASKNDAVNFLGTAKSLGSREPWVLLPQS